MFEAVGGAGDEPDFGVDRFGESVGEAVFEGCVDGVAVPLDCASEFDEGGDAAALCPGDPVVEGVFAGLAFDGEDVAQALFEQVAAIEARVGFGDPVELVALVVGEVLGVLPERVTGVL